MRVRSPRKNPKYSIKETAKIFRIHFLRRTGSILPIRRKTRNELIAKLVHISQPKEKDPLLGAMEGLVETIGDLTEPVIHADAWELD